MIQAIREKVTVQKGGVVQVSSPSLPDGAKAEVIVLIDLPKKQTSLSQMIGTAQSLFSSPEEVDQFLQEERHSWQS